MRVIIAGSRDVPSSLGMVDEACHQFMVLYGPITEVICGMARGADLLGKEWADRLGIPVLEMPADWDNLGKGAGFIRNQDMVNVAQGAVFLWDGQSRGTQDCMRRAKKKGIPIYIHQV